jgi:hypothetical protein
MAAAAAMDMADATGHPTGPLAGAAAAARPEVSPEVLASLGEAQQPFQSTVDLLAMDLDSPTAPEVHKSKVEGQKAKLTSDKRLGNGAQKGRKTKDVMATDEEIKESLKAYVHNLQSIRGTTKGRWFGKPSLRTAAEVYARGNSSAVTRAFEWVETQAPDDGTMTPSALLAKRVDAIECYASAKPKAGNPKNTSFFSKDERDVIYAQIRASGELGWPMDRKMVQEMCQDMARRKLEADERAGRIRDVIYEVEDNSGRGDIPLFGPGFYNKFLEDYPDLKEHKTSAIDPLRSAQASLDVAVSFEEMVGKVLMEMADKGEIKYEAGGVQWNSLETCPAYLKFNMDEVGVNGNLARTKKLSSRKAKSGSWNALQTKLRSGQKDLQRMFDPTTQGDKDPLPHRSLAITTCGNGKSRCRLNEDGSKAWDGKGEPGDWLRDEENKIVGAPCPMLIQVDGSKDLRHHLSQNQRAGILDASGDSPSGIKVVCDKSGSMTRWSFEVWCQHFVDQLPDGLGKDGASVLLFLDGHTSRWSYLGLKLLRENNVIAICLPSHTR